MMFGNADPCPANLYSGLSKIIPPYEKFNLPTHLIQRLQMEAINGAKTILPNNNGMNYTTKVNNTTSCDVQHRSATNYGENIAFENDNQSRPPPYMHQKTSAACMDDRVNSLQKGLVGIQHRKIRKCYSNESQNIPHNNNNNSNTASLNYNNHHLLASSSVQTNKMAQQLPFHLQPLIPPLSINSQSTVSCGAPPNTTTSRYKTELCRPFEESGECKYGDKCQFAHGISEMRNLSRHPKYKTELCRTFHSIGFCPYGPRCHFIHNKEEAGTLIMDDDKDYDYRNDSYKMYLNQSRHHSLPTNFLQLVNNAGTLQIFSAACANDMNSMRPSYFSTGQLTLSSSQLYDSIQNTIAIAAASAAINFNNTNNNNNNSGSSGGPINSHNILSSRKSLPTLLPSPLQQPQPPHKLNQTNNINRSSLCSTNNVSDLMNSLKYLNFNTESNGLVHNQHQNIKKEQIYNDDNQGSACDSGIEDNIYTNLLSSLMRKQLTTTNNNHQSNKPQVTQQLSSPSSASLLPNSGNNVCGVKQNNGTSSPDSNFSATSDGIDESSDSSDNKIYNPRLPIFKSFSTEGY